MSKISRERTVAYARKQRASTSGGDVGEDGGASDAPAPAPEAVTEGTPAAAPGETTEGTPEVASEGTAEAAPGETAEPASEPAPDAAPDAADAPGAASAAASEVTSDASATPDAASAAETESTAAAAPSAPTAAADAQTARTPVGDSPRPADSERVRSQTVAMPAHASIGGPPAMPAGSAPIAEPVDVAVAEAPTHMPGPREIPAGDPDDPAQPPGRVPSGDSRSLRRRAERYEFALIYRIQTYVISRFGVVGTRGQWRVVEYPTSASASHSYAKECSRFAADGFSDYRD